MQNLPLLKTTDISKSFDYDLFDNINLSLWSRQSIAIMGRSGSGKSTLLHILATLMKPDSGKVEIMGKDIYKLSQKEIELFRRDKLGIIFQSHYLFKGMSALDNIRSATLLSGTKIDNDLLAKLEIDNIIGKRVGDISGGQQQRVSIARVLSKKPKIIFADEPTGNLDRTTANLVMDVLDEYIKLNNASLFIVTHDLEIAHKSQKLYILDHKKLSVR